MHEGRMATGAGEGGGHTALENTTATALTESSSSSSSSSVPTILAENNTSTNLPLPGPQQQTLHQVQQQQQTQQQQQQQQQQTHSRPPINLVTDLPANDTSAVRADRMRGGRNKFGPMYKRDRARKLQMMRQRQLALQTIRGSLGDPSNYPSAVTPFLHIKQEIQIPQVSSLTSSPDSSPSPAAVAAGLVTTQAGSGAGQHQLIAPSSQPNISGGNHLHNLNPGLDSKLWAANSTTPSPKAFNFGEQSTHGAAGSAPSTATLKTSPMIRDFVQTVDDREWQASLFGLLQNQTYNQCEVDLFELMCKVLDQNLFSQVDWARNSVFFKDLKVDDQMKLLQHSWSDMLVLDHLHQRLHNNLPDETTLHNGQKFDLLCLGLLGVPSLADLFNDLSSKLQELKFDLSDYICMKFLMLLNHEVRGLVNKKHVQDGHEQVQQALLDYTLTCYPSIPDKFNKLLAVLPGIHVVASRGEDHLYQKHCSGGAPTQTLLMEMLHAKRK
ncbi:nuclear hormone receptor FTZ-F1 [Bombus impatiens]|uniref:Nuclear hormone receptor FTZ-F1 n=1 Tax=Bombus impatiens TaxID=132113 RepID=A0A6P3UPU1_BOMIM|nr:nuclear hormone receptor FTZ-F1 [Bombus impatiens]